MIICIDSGNSRLKWGAYADGAWLDKGAVAQADLARLADLPARFQPTAVWLANVAGAAVGDALRQVLAPWQGRLVEAHSAAAACGVTNHYENPARLGVDRWHALLGARGLTPRACLVVMAGTATTIDTLDAAGHFLGGLILPGVDLMRQALARDTAGLPLASGRHQAYPRGTDDAIVSGCLEAQAGAIERAFARIAPQAGALCLLSGGAAGALGALLGIPHRPVDNLVLDGLARRATSAE